MTIVVPPPQIAPTAPPTASPRPKRFSAAEFLSIYQAGLFGRDKGVELIGGEVFEMAPTGSGHAAAHGRLAIAFAPLMKGGAGLAIAPTIEFSADDVCEPDIAITKLPAKSNELYYAPNDLLLVVEVANSSLNADLKTKARIYAGAGIADYWVLDLANRRLIVHRGPEADGYNSITRLSADETIAPLCAADVTITIGDLFA